METEVLLYALLWVGFLTFEIVIGVRITKNIVKRIKKWHAKRTLMDLK